MTSFMLPGLALCGGSESQPGQAQLTSAECKVFSSDPTAWRYTLNTTTHTMTAEEFAASHAAHDTLPTPDELAEIEQVIADLGAALPTMDALAERAYKAICLFSAKKQRAYALGLLDTPGPEDPYTEAWSAAWKLMDEADAVRNLFGPASGDFNPCDTTNPGWYSIDDDPEQQERVPLGSAEAEVARADSSTEERIAAAGVTEETAPATPNPLEEAERIESDLQKLKRRAETLMAEVVDQTPRPLDDAMWTITSTATDLSDAWGLLLRASASTAEIREPAAPTPPVAGEADHKVDPQIGISVGFNFSPEMRRIKDGFAAIQYRLSELAPELAAIGSEYARLAVIAEREISAALDAMAIDVEEREDLSDGLSGALAVRIGYRPCLRLLSDIAAKLGDDADHIYGKPLWASPVDGDS